MAAMLGAAAVAADGPSVDGVLVLHNGHVLSGSIRRIGDAYRIEARGGTLQVPAGQVDRFAPSLAAAYEARRRERVGGSADAHVELARWCLQLELLDEAARELLDARTLEPGHRGAAIVELQLRQLIETHARSQAAADSQAAATATGEIPHGRQVGGDDAAPIAEGLPEISVDARVQFVRSIQPMLVQSCATGGCHQPGSTQALQLDRLALVGNGNAEIVRRNLTAVLRELEVDDPLASPLLHMARTPHGGNPRGGSRPISARQAALLVEWLNAAAGIDPQSTFPAPVADGAGAAGKGVELAVYDEPLGEPAAATPAARFRPRDAFDPEVFNRRFVELAAEFEPGPDNDLATEPLEPLEPLEAEAQSAPSPTAEP